jgi:hypothetical protein
VSAYGIAALCVFSAALGAAGATTLGLARSHADTGARVALLEHTLACNTERLEGVTRELSALRAGWKGTRAVCPEVATGGSAAPAPAPPEHDVAPALAADDAPSAAEQELIAEAEQVLDRAARQGYWGERERDEWRRIVPRLPGSRALGLVGRAVRGLNGDFPARTHGPPF